MRASRVNGIDRVCSYCSRFRSQQNYQREEFWPEMKRKKLDVDNTSPKITKFFRRDPGVQDPVAASQDDDIELVHSVSPSKKENQPTKDSAKDKSKMYGQPSTPQWPHNNDPARGWTYKGDQLVSPHQHHHHRSSDREYFNAQPGDDIPVHLNRQQHKNNHEHSADDQKKCPDYIRTQSEERPYAKVYNTTSRDRYKRWSERNEQPLGLYGESYTGNEEPSRPQKVRRTQSEGVLRHSHRHNNILLTTSENQDGLFCGFPGQSPQTPGSAVGLIGGAEAKARQPQHSQGGAHHGYSRGALQDQHQEPPVTRISQLTKNPMTLEDKPMLPSSQPELTNANINRACENSAFTLDTQPNPPENTNLVENLKSDETVIDDPDAESTHGLKAETTDGSTRECDGQLQTTAAGASGSAKPVSDEESNSRSEESASELPTEAVADDADLHDCDDLEEIDEVPRLILPPSPLIKECQEPSPTEVGLDMKLGDNDSQSNIHGVVSKPCSVVLQKDSVQKGIENLRRIFRTGISYSPSSVSSGITPVPLVRSLSQASNGSGFDVDMSEDSDSDDNDLLPSILSNRLTSAPKAEPQVPSLPDSDFESETEMPTNSQPDPSGGFSLDALLRERNQKEEVDRQFALIEHELQEGIKQGGVKSIRVENSEELTPELKETLQTMEVAETVICDHHPGEVVFHPERFEQIFSYPGTLTLESCGFTVGETSIDKQLSTLQPDMLDAYLTNGPVELCFTKITTPKALLTWLIQRMSIEKNQLVADRAKQIIYHVLRMKDNKSCDWAPDVETVQRIFVNFGADPSAFPPIKICTDEVENRALASSSPSVGAVASGIAPGSADKSEVNPEPNGVPPAAVNHRAFQLANLRRVLFVLADVIHLRSEQYTASDLLHIIVMIFKISLDTRLNQHELDYDIQIVLSSLLYAIATDDWRNTVEEVCRFVPTLTSHHHNAEYMVSLLPPCDRGRYLQRRLAWSTLHHVLLHRLPTIPASVHDFRIEHLLYPVKKIMVRGDGVDYYKLSNIVSLIDFSVGNEELPSKERDDLCALLNLLKAKMGDIRDSITVIDRTVVKDHMVRLTSKWQFHLQNMGSNERTIFAYTMSNTPFLMEKVQSMEQEVEGERSESESMATE